MPHRLALSDLRTPILWLLAISLVVWACSGERDDGDGGKSVGLLSVSYDPTRELYTDVDAAFVRSYKERTGVAVTIKQSHGGSGKQARSVIDGLEADVVSLALAGDVDAIAARGLLDPAWQGRLPERSSPYTSTIVFVVRRGNPKQIADWGDLVEAGRRRHHAEPEDVRRRAVGVPRRVGPREDHARHRRGGPRLPEGAVRERAGARLRRARRDHDVRRARPRRRAPRVGERGAPRSLDRAGDAFEIVVPPRSILAEPPVAVVDRYAAKHGTTDVAKAYLEFLYTEEGQQIIARHHYRPRSARAAAAAAFPKLELFTIDNFGGWAGAQAAHFADGGTFDRIYAK